MNRRHFFKKTGLLILTAILVMTLLESSYSKKLTKAFLAPFQNEVEAVRKGQKIGIGSAKLEGPKVAKVSSFQTFSVEYTAGKAGIKPGGGMRISLRHLTSWWSSIQIDDPKADGYVTAKTSTNIPVSLSLEFGIFGERFFTMYHPWQNILEVKVDQPGLKSGDKMIITFGDGSGGSRGFKFQPFDETKFVLKLYVDAIGNGEYLPLESNPAVKIVAAEPYKISIVNPSNAVVGKPGWSLVRVEDRFGNPVTDYTGTISFKSTDNSAVIPEKFTFTKHDDGVHRLEDIVFKTPGIQRILVSGGLYDFISNPVQVSKDKPEKLLLWGDIHGHTLNSDGRGTTKEYYEFAEKVAGLDFCSVTDHAFEMTEDMWENSKVVTNEFDQSGKFVTINAYEWSGLTELGGDHNFYWIDDDPPIYRSGSYYNPENLQMYHGKEPKIKNIKELMELVEKRHFKDKNVFCIPHFGGRKGNPKWHNPKVQRLIEVFSEHQRSEEWVIGFLKKGYRLGIMASGDGHYGNPGYGYLKPERSVSPEFNQEIGMGLTAVYAEDNTRRSIFKALYARHCYATSGDRIILDFKADGHIMGSEYKTEEKPKIYVNAVGTDEIKSVQIKKNCGIVYTHQPGAKSVEFNWIDDDFAKGDSCFYYVVVNQVNNEQAISSPVWVN